MALDYQKLCEFRPAMARDGRPPFIWTTQTARKVLLIFIAGSFSLIGLYALVVTLAAQALAELILKLLNVVLL